MADDSVGRAEEVLFGDDFYRDASKRLGALSRDVSAVVEEVLTRIQTDYLAAGRDLALPSGMVVAGHAAADSVRATGALVRALSSPSTSRAADGPMSVHLGPDSPSTSAALSTPDS